MAYTYSELKKRTLVDLRNIAAGITHDAVQGYTQMNKEHLLNAICNAVGIDMHEHHQVVGLNKAEIKAQIRDLKKERDNALATHDQSQLRAVRRRIHHLKRQIHKATV
jgi:DNA-binding IclR family transcriptional regulator